MPVFLFVIPYRHPGYRFAATGRDWVIVTCPDLDIVGQVEQLSRRRVQAFGATAWEVASRTADIRMENGISTEDVTYTYEH